MKPSNTVDWGILNKTKTEWVYFVVALLVVIISNYFFD